MSISPLRQVSLFYNVPCGSIELRTSILRGGVTGHWVSSWNASKRNAVLVTPDGLWKDGELKSLLRYALGGKKAYVDDSDVIRLQAAVQVVLDLRGRINDNSHS